MGKIGSPHIKDFESKFRERGLEPLEKIKDAKIHTEIYGSDHCPVELDLDF